MELRFNWKAFLTQSQIVGMVCLAQYWTNMWTSQTVQILTFDRIALLILLFGGINLVIMLAGDRLARSRGWSKPSAYVLLGALASSAAHAVALAPAGYINAAKYGAVVFIVGIPALIGAMSGFLLHRSLGYVHYQDDPESLAAVAGTNQPAADSGQFGLLSANGQDYYDGPLQIRTSGMAAWVAALIGASIVTVMFLFSLTDGQLPAGVLPPLYRSNPAMAGLLSIAIWTVPFLFFVRKSHDFLQSRGKDSVKSYALAGLFVPLGFASMLLVLMGPFALFIVLPWIFPSAIAMVVYRRLAGVEPLALPDDIEVTDRRTLIPADHVRRRVRRVIPAD